jgi:hypothetical protein
MFMRAKKRVPASIARKLGHYVYLYVNPLTDEVFYVGKGKNSRVFSHGNGHAKKHVEKVIREIRAVGEEPRIEILTHGLPSEEVAFQVEAAAIDLLGVDNLANAIRGWHGATHGRMPVEEVVAHYVQKRVEVREPSLLIRINKSYRYGMTEAELYDATRSAWRLGTRAERAEYAFAVFQGVVREVYEICGWLDGGATFNNRTGGRPALRRGRWEFVGAVADEKIRKRYVNRYVGHYFKRGQQSPIKYVNVDKKASKVAASHRARRRK